MSNVEHGADAFDAERLGDGRPACGTSSAAASTAVLEGFAAVNWKNRQKMLLEELKKKIKSADDSNLEDVDSVCVSWLLDAADDGLRGDEGKTAQKLLEIVKELLDIKDDI